jgi:hypothetical protein
MRLSPRIKLMIRYRIPNPNISSNIKRIFYNAPPAINQLYNPIAYAELGGAPAVGSYGLGYGTTGYLLVPTSLTIQTAQAIEMQNTVIGSNYTFEIINNKLRIFPIPDYDNVYSFLSESMINYMLIFF